MKDKPIISVVIVCMNNLKNLIPCLDSIALYTKVPYEIWVNAYMFTCENLELVRKKYPHIHFVENNEISGFAENNNIILRRLKTEYILVLNDDTLFKEPVIDKLLTSIKNTKDATVMSPKLVNADGTYQSCGRPPINWYNFLKEDIFSINNDKVKSKYVNQKGIFKTYNITGACFLIRNRQFAELGFFDEYYFFTPEDIALSTKINELGGSCYVDSSVILYHLSGGTRKSIVKVATLPSQRKGCVKFHSRGSKSMLFFLECIVFWNSLLKFCVFFLTRDKIERIAQYNCLCSIFSRKTPKDVFVKYYNKYCVT